MAHDDTSTDPQSVGALLDRAYELIRHHDIVSAAGCLEEALSIDFDNSEVVTSLKYVNFWKDRQATAEEISNTFERGEYLLGQWKLFHGFVERVGATAEACQYALRQHVFGQALDYYLELYRDSDGQDPELLLRIGRCYKGKGEYDRALGYLETAAAHAREDAEVLAELADTYAMVNEIQKAKAFFREAFFIDATKVDVSSLESEMIGRLIGKVRELGYESPALEEWIPVYGVLFGVFTVKRELRSIEYGKLKQSIYALEREYKERGKRESALEARLINRYFWLIDHYVSSREDRSKIDEVLLKIRATNSKIYHQYTN
jgi:tetratricopeptide (TPR) repeat protein